MATILDGKTLSMQCKEDIKKQAEALAEKGFRPGMAVVLVGENPASKVYVRNKEKDCQECGIYSAMYHLPEETTEQELLDFRLRTGDALDEETLARLKAAAGVSGVRTKAA